MTSTALPINPSGSQTITSTDPISFTQSFIDGFNDPKFSRAGLLTSERLFAMPVFSTLLGFAIDGYSGGKMASYRYRAEHQHKKPKSIQQWYFYHKTKNYKVILESIYKGSRMTAKLTALSCSFLVLEYCGDFVTDRKLPIVSSTLAGLVTATVVGKFRKFLYNIFIICFY
ncbi:hypothetical protein CONCODRAFT_34262 [Conidiobolus coronatus NRRL 28638]|uniref:Uncharacterized protein n=1 Tax=Conidiobolus coronatus (strain ATCC 28846 / CBS 209.66 / NRRL 28638) TaxID=796925 RepID=A0A137PI13_CONC2|nr:hypothetical protein CONCODRAFT_34262 [Conidiobolus coronatus NRRL 28638]|eukprot:KXN74637.1 hypothetical protein CONCODRAFT_34262 [Conidiobolus coronatus NRRL 28638]